MVTQDSLFSSNTPLLSRGSCLACETPTKEPYGITIGNSPSKALQRDRA